MSLLAMMVLSSMQGCSGDAGPDTDTRPPGETTDTASVLGDTGASGHTADTGFTLPEGLHGEPPPVPVPPLPSFEVFDTLGIPRGSADLYDQRTVLLLSQGAGDGRAEVLGVGFEAIRPALQDLGVEVVSVTPELYTSNANWRALNDLRYEVWSDSSVVLFAHYMVPQSLNETRLLDGEGNLVLVYESAMIALDVEGHAANVLEDVELLWGDGTR